MQRFESCTFQGPLSRPLLHQQLWLVTRLPKTRTAKGCGDRGLRAHPTLLYIYMVVDLKVLVSSVYDDDPEHIKISFGESFFSSWRK